MKLFANGCSFTWGGAIYPSLHDLNAGGQLLDYYNTSELNQQRLRDTWPDQLGNLLGATESVNMSMGCGSNDRILRTTLDFFTDKIAKQQSQDWLAVIQWTQTHRYEYWDENTNSWAMVIPSGVSVGRPVPWAVTQELDRLKDVTYSYQNDITYAQRYWTQVISLASFFKLHGIRYWFSNLSMDTWPALSQEQQNYLKTNMCWFKDDPYYQFGNLFKDRHEKGSGHPSLLGQQQIAESIYKIIKDQL